MGVSNIYFLHSFRFRTGEIAPQIDYYYAGKTLKFLLYLMANSFYSDADY